MNPKVQTRIIGHLIVLVVVVCSLASAASAEWKEKVLYSFQGGTDGQLPGGGVIFDKAGNLYGVTIEGGSTACPPGWCGKIYQLSPPAQKGGAWSETVLYVFKGHDQNDGSSPSGGLIADSAGNFYGVTGYGGSGPCVLFGTATGCGTVFELSPPAQEGGAWTETVLYNFQGGKDGDLPTGPLAFDKAGNLYGATEFGGGKGTTCDAFYGGNCGTVFELTPPKSKGGEWTEKMLYSFAGIGQGKQDGYGAEPNGGLTLDSKGKVYGTTYIGGYNCPHNSNQGCGTVFELKPPTAKGHPWTEEQLHIFKNSNDGAQPGTGVVMGARGSLYGGAEGGAKEGGVVFRLAATSGGPWTETILYAFTVAPEGGYDPTVARFDASGTIYGTTNVGPGESLAGSVFRLRPPSREAASWQISVLHGFTNNPDGAFPNTPLTFDSSGRIYGATQFGGTGQSCQRGCGTVFAVSP
ncbi:MAG: choice-of-anchor tandem repeat GloVer-containing protein [Terriglobales bacterium]